MKRSALMLGLALASCAHVDADSETVAEHRNDAAIHQERAREERAQHDPSDVRRPAPHMPGAAEFGLPEYATEPYNPGDDHLRRADAEMSEANAHLVAAKSLITFKNKACEGLSEGERSACPLFASTVRTVQPSSTGFTLLFKPTADVDQTFARWNCHLAWAIATGFDRPSCPLFLRGTTMKRSGTEGIEFIGESPTIAGELQRQARRIFMGAGPSLTISAP